MKIGLLCAIRLVTVASLFVPNILWTKMQEITATNLVVVEGLKPTYASCGLVKFSVRNSSQDDIYVEAYAEVFKSNRWDYADYPYNLRDPESRYVKRVIVNPDMTKPGQSLLLTYDRCLKPRFINGTQISYSAAIKKKDNRSTAKIFERIRVDVHLLERGHVERNQLVVSKSFARVPDMGHAESPPH